MNEETRRAIQAAKEALQETTLEQSARIGAQRFLLEQLFAHAFINDPKSFAALLDKMIERTRNAPSPTGPIGQDDLLELQARTATHLQRFQQDVLSRMQQGYQA